MSKVPVSLEEGCEVLGPYFLKGISDVVLQATELGFNPKDRLEKIAIRNNIHLRWGDEFCRIFAPQDVVNRINSVSLKCFVSFQALTDKQVFDAFFIGPGSLTESQFYAIVEICLNNKPVYPDRGLRVCYVENQDCLSTVFIQHGSDARGAYVEVGAMTFSDRYLWEQRALFLVPAMTDLSTAF